MNSHQRRKYRRLQWREAKREVAEYDAYLRRMAAQRNSAAHKAAHLAQAVKALAPDLVTVSASADMKDAVLVYANPAQPPPIQTKSAYAALLKYGYKLNMAPGSE